MSYIRLVHTDIYKNTVKFRFEVSPDLSKYFTSEYLWIEYEKSIEDIPLSIINCAFVGIMSGCAWLTNSIIYLYSLDESFYKCLSRLREAYSYLYPKSHLWGNVVAGEIIDNKIPNCNPNSKLLLFSGGVDCLTTYIRHASSEILLFNIYGWKHRLSDENNVAESDKLDGSKFAEKYNQTFSFAASNFAVLFTKDLDRICKKQTGEHFWFGFLHSMAFISISVPLAFQKHISKILIASSFHFKTEEVGASHSTTDNEFRYADQGRVCYDGSTLTRQDKISTIVQYQKKIGQPLHLKVCSFNDHNCLTCEKCFRTIMGLIAENANPQEFGFSFKKPIADFYIEFFSNVENIAKWGSYIEVHHYKYTKKKIESNYNNIEEKKLADWFLNFDFIKEKKKALLKYRTRNFFKIIKRRLKHK